MDILLLRTWQTNIGNAIIERGARALLERSFPEAKIIETSAYPNYISSRREKTRFTWRNIVLGISSLLRKTTPLNRIIKLFHGQDQTRDPSRATPGGLRRLETGNQDLMNLTDFIDVDLVVLPGCVLGSAFAILEPTLRRIRSRGIPLILLGAGGYSYRPGVTAYVSNILEEIEPSALFTRDADAYDEYARFAEDAYQGIDCGLFINDWYDPPTSNQTLSAVVFDKMDEPSLEIDHEVIRLHHAPFNNPEMGYSNRFSALFPFHYFEPISSSFFESKNALISDNLRDYLFVYSNAEITHADRIHACIPALAYGNKARFHYDTTRAKLFDTLKKKGILQENHDSELLEINSRQLRAEKKNIVKKLKQSVQRST